MAVPAAGDDGTELEIPVRDENGAMMAGGKVVFCPDDAPCLELDIDERSIIRLDRTWLVLDRPYTVLVYAASRNMRYADSYWVFDSAVPHDAEPELTGSMGERLRVVIPPRAGAADVAADAEPAPAAVAAATGTEVHHRRFLAAVIMPLMLGGNFGTDDDALGGVSSVSAGWGLTGSYRFGTPARRTLGHRTGVFRELSFTYAQNRYHVEPIQSTDQGSDLTFHRFYLAYGLGRFWQRSQGGVALAASYGGIYDGSTLVEYDGRTYGMFGLGLQARYVYRVAGRGDGLGVGLFGQLELMYYFADAGENDHWYGWEPSVAFGVAIH